METSVKYWPVEYHSMTAVDVALKVRERAGPLKPEDVESIEVKTFTVSYKIPDPKTRDSRPQLAIHSGGNAIRWESFA